MFCKNCGKPLKEGAQFCNECGAKVTQTTQTAPPAQTDSGAALQPVQAAAPQTDSGAAPKKEKKEYPIWVPKLVVVIALICFFFPFMTVSCGVEEVGSSATVIELTGKDMIFGNSETSEDVADYYDENYDEDVDASTFNIFVCLAAILAVVSLFISKKYRSWGSSATIWSAIFLVIFRLSAKSYYKIGDESLKELVKSGMFDVSFGVAFYIALILLIVATFIFTPMSELDDPPEDSKNSEKSEESPPKDSTGNVT
ncbi:MAG: zinc ribbon domain-containing protein [Ruminococcus sp.]|nr:zinc ribbon domain-containing protein [Ruminococcus sp.]